LTLNSLAASCAEYTAPGGFEKNKTLAYFDLLPGIRATAALRDSNPISAIAALTGSGTAAPPPTALPLTVRPKLALQTS
jgi:hypothetical protein